MALHGDETHWARARGTTPLARAQKKRAGRSTRGCAGPPPIGSTWAGRPVPPIGSPVISGSSPLLQTTGSIR